MIWLKLSTFNSSRHPSHTVRAQIPVSGNGKMTSQKMESALFWLQQP